MTCLKVSDHNIVITIVISHAVKHASDDLSTGDDGYDVTHYEWRTQMQSCSALIIIQLQCRLAACARAPANYFTVNYFIVNCFIGFRFLSRS